MNAFVRTLATVTKQAAHQGIAVCDLKLDSRDVMSGDVFFALALDDQLRQQHASAAVAAGAVAVVTDRDMTAANALLSVPVVVMPEIRQPSALGQVASRFYECPSDGLCVVGITGTNGKTTCSQWLAEAWSALCAPAAAMGTLGYGLFVDGARDASVTGVSGLTTADVLSNHRVLRLVRDAGAEAAMMEVSSHALDQERVAAIHFDTAIFTNLTQDHLDYHGNMEAYAAAKQKLFDRQGLRWAIINVDDAFGRTLADRLRQQSNGCQVLTCSLQDKSAEVGVERSAATADGVVATIWTPWGKGELQSKYPGGFNLLNLLAVVATLCCHGMALSSVLNVVSRLQPVPGRTQIVSENSDGVLVIVDYAHTPDALHKILAAARERCAGQLWCVFGCGGNRDRGKRPQMGAIAVSQADRCVVTSDNPRNESPESIIADIVSGCGTSPVVVEVNRAIAIERVIAEAKPGDVIVVAGKGHETYQEINGKRHPFSDVQVAKAALIVRQAQVRRADA